VAATEASATTDPTQDWTDFAHTGPGTLAGRFMRMFWQPVYLSKELPAGRAVPIRIMSEDFTLYRGEGGGAHVVAFRCAHRGTQLSTGWVEGDDLRCFYHGWKYNGEGQCTEQPAEPEPFCQRIRIRSYPTQEYLGLIFAYLGEDAPPPFPRYPDFEGEGILEADRFLLPVNFFSALDNDPVHVYFVHRQPRADYREWNGWIPEVRAEPTTWGRVTRSPNPDSGWAVAHRGMPNLVVRKSSSEANRRQEAQGQMDFLEWKLPIDDENHWDVHVLRVHLTGDAAQKWLERRDEELKRRDLPAAHLAAEIVAGTLSMDEVDRSRTRMTSVQDLVAFLGQGRIADRSNEHLGRTDVGVVMLRQLWQRELRALAEGRPLTQWHRSEEMLTGQ
jgi:5,5'-dehydrodivanillate O-demethylase